MLFNSNFPTLKIMQFLISRASAGSGKTTTLVLRYLQLALPKPDAFGRILAVTFTNSAAAEMKRRIIEFLSDCSSSTLPAGQTAQMVADLRSLTGLSDVQLQDASRDLLNQILHRYADFSICTIDSFLHGVVRSFAKDLGLAWEFKVEVDYGPRMRRAVDEVMDTIGPDQAGSQFWFDVARERLSRGQSPQSIDRSVLELATSVYNSDEIMNWVNQHGIDYDALKTVKGAIESEYESSSQQIAQCCAQAHVLIESFGLTPADFSHGERGIAGYFEKYRIQSKQLVTPNNNINSVFESGKWHSTKSNASARRKIEQIKGELTKCYEGITAISRRHNICHLMLNKMHVLGTLLPVLTKFEELKKIDRVVTITDFNRLIRPIVEEEPVPFIYERVGDYYLHYLVDEFQDTSTSQWENLLPLFHNAIAAGGFGMVVGDPKQAIYRWRGGDAEQFVRLPSLISEHPDASLMENTLTEAHQLETPDINYRSLSEIVNFNNDLFSVARGLVDHQDFYDHYRQTVPENRDGGYVTVRAIDRKTYLQDYLIHLRGHLAAILERGFRLKDIAILTRLNSEAADIADEIKNYYDIVTAESLHLDRSPKVLFLLACFRYLADRDDLIARSDMMHLFSEVAGYSPDYLSCRDRTAFLKWFESNGVSFSTRSLSRLPLLDLTVELIRIFNLEPQPDAYVQHFLDAVIAFAEDYGQDPPDFLQWWQSKPNPLSIVLPDEADAIRILTIHKAKGLQFPVVLIPQATWTFSGSRDLVRVETGYDDMPETLVSMTSGLNHAGKQALYEEEMGRNKTDGLNLLYVATTRSIYELHLFTVAQEPKNEVKGTSAILSIFLDSMRARETAPGLYEWGHAAAATQQGIKPNDALENTTTIPVQSRSNLRIRSRYQEVWGSDAAQLRKQGILLHGVLSHIRTAADISPVLVTFQNEGILTHEQADATRVSLTNLVEHSEIGRFFSVGLTVRTEMEIVHQGEIMRLDRLIEESGKATVLDFKTGHPDKNDRQQVERYADAVNSLGFENVEAFLIYTDPLNLVKVR